MTSIRRRPGRGIVACAFASLALAAIMSGGSSGAELADAPSDPSGSKVKVTLPYTNPPHFDGRHFFNPEGDRQDTPVWGLIKWGLTREVPEWKEILVTPSIPPKEVGGDTLRATWVGHATVLAQWRGVNFLTDPNWSDRASPVTFAGPKRYAAPGVRFQDLPAIQFVVISHSHYDHMDEMTVRELHRAHHPTFFVPMGVKRWFDKAGISDAVELDWWQSRQIGPFEVTCVPVKHFSGRSPFDRNRTLWCGWVVSGDSGSFFFAGDTGYTKFFSEIGRTFAPIRLATLPIGAYEPRWFMSPVHINPDEAVQAHIDLRARASMGMHFNTFRLTDEPRDEPPRKIREALAVAGIPEDAFWVPTHGDSRTY